MNKSFTIEISLLVGIIFISGSLVSHNVLASKSKGDLTVIVKLKYSKTALDLPQNYKKVRLTIDAEHNKYYDLSDHPSQIKVKHLDIGVGEKFEIHLNNPKTDDGEQAKGINSKQNRPELVSIKVP